MSYQPDADLLWEVGRAVRAVLRDEGEIGEVTYHGTLYAVRDAQGRYHRVPNIAVGTLHGHGLVTARNRSDLESGRYVRPGAGAAFVPIVEVFYRRRRGPPYPGTHWRHEVETTDIGRSRHGLPVFRHRGDPVFVCVAPTGDFMCGG